MFALAATAQTNDKPSSPAAAPDKSADTDSKPDAKQADDGKAKPDDEKKADDKKADDNADQKKPEDKKPGEAKPGEAKPGESAPANNGSAPAGANAAAPAAPAAAAPAAPAAPPAAAAPAAQPAPAAAAPAAQPAPAVAATGPASASPTADQGAGAGADKPKPPPEKTFGIEIDAGTNARLDGATPGYSNHEAVDLTYGGGLWLAPSRLYALGLSFQRAGIGSETSPPTGNSVAVTRDLNTLWLGGRVYPLRGDTAGLYIRLNLGASWQHVNASGTTITGQYVATAKPFACSASQGPGFAIGGGVGGDIDLDSHLAFIADAGFGAHRLSGDAVGGCAPGSGSVTNLAARIGFMYRFDLGGSSSKAAASSQHVVERF